MPATHVRELLARASERLHESVTARRDAELLLMRSVGRDRAWLLTHPEALLTTDQIDRFQTWIDRRAQHEPMQYILGETEFYGLTLKVTPDVLIPRPETEHLVETALEHLPRDVAARICDVGTGSGCIAVALAHELPQAQVTAVDTSTSALAVARENAMRHALEARIRFVQSDLLAAVTGTAFDLIVSNPPYVANEENVEPQVGNYEPHAALFAGATGLEVYRRLIPQAHAMLVPGGWLLMEIGHGQRDALCALLDGWEDVRFNSDLQGIPRVAMARRRA